MAHDEIMSYQNTHYVQHYLSRAIWQTDIKVQNLHSLPTEPGEMQ